MLLWLVTSNCFDYMCLLICTHAHTFVSDIRNPPKKYKTIRNIGPNSYSREKNLEENEIEAFKRREGYKLGLLDLPKKRYN